MGAGSLYSGPCRRGGRGHAVVLRYLEFAKGIGAVAISWSNSAASCSQSLSESFRAAPVMALGGWWVGCGCAVFGGGGTDSADCETERISVGATDSADCETERISASPRLRRSACILLSSRTARVVGAFDGGLITAESGENLVVLGVGEGELAAEFRVAGGVRADAQLAALLDESG